ERITRGAVGLFHPRLYLSGGDCIECGNEMMSRGKFERLAGTATAKWHVSIKVLPSGVTLGRWLQKHGLPVLQGRPRKRKAAECEGEYPEDAEDRHGDTDNDDEPDQDDDQDEDDDNDRMGYSSSVTESSLPPPQSLHLTLQPPRALQPFQPSKELHLSQEPPQPPQPTPLPKPTQMAPWLCTGVGRAHPVDEHSTPVGSPALTSNTETAVGNPFNNLAATTALEVCGTGDLPDLAAAMPPWKMPGTSMPSVPHMPCAPAPAGQIDHVAEESMDTPVMELLESLGILEEIYDTSDVPVGPSYSHIAAPTTVTRAGSEHTSLPNSSPGIPSLSAQIASPPMSSWIMQPQGLGSNTPSDGGGGGGGDSNGDGDGAAATAAAAERPKDYLEEAYSNRWSISGAYGDRQFPPVGAAAASRSGPITNALQRGFSGGNGNGGGCGGSSSCGGVDNGLPQRYSGAPSQTPSRADTGSEPSLNLP
ncbi:hypothetical protein VaNZ11_001069, partial [Volvox africanus]